MKKAKNKLHGNCSMGIKFGSLAVRGFSEFNQFQQLSAFVYLSYILKTEVIKKSVCCQQQREWKRVSIGEWSVQQITTETETTFNLCLQNSKNKANKFRENWLSKLYCPPTCIAPRWRKNEMFLSLRHQIGSSGPSLPCRFPQQTFVCWSWDRIACCARWRSLGEQRRERSQWKRPNG